MPTLGKVRMTWRTRGLLLLAAVVASVVTWIEVSQRRERPAPPPPSTIDVEIVSGP